MAACWWAANGPGHASSFLTLIGSADTIAKVGTAHHRIKAQLFDLLAVAVNLSRYTNDPLTPDHCHQLRSGSSRRTPPTPTTDRYLNNLANHVAALYQATGNREHLTTAIEHAQTAVAHPADSNDRPGRLSNLLVSPPTRRPGTVNI
ncbi:MAG: hypothetical protein R2754_12335 [Microthrixaceae bacterium]